MRRFGYAVSLWVALAGATAMAAEIKVLSAGAVEPGLHAFAERVQHDMGHELKIQFNTGPQITKRLAAGETYDILIAPPALIEQAAKDGRAVADTRVPVGRVGAGIIVRSGAPLPDVSTTEALKRAVLAADSVVYNTASSGIYLEKLFARLGVLEQLKPKTTRYPNGEAVMMHVINGKGNEIGFGAITEIKLFEPKGLKLVGPLPAEVQNYTSYEAALMAGAPSADAARAVLKQLATAQGKQAFVAAGIE
ncbi:MAG TPA: substrate-binding domain-containing protein [Burkholderiales bacterium]|nr:substrate-binding domain-containing protein [Burkholderiales bacterium]